MKKIALPIRVEGGPAGSKCLVAQDAELILSTQDATDDELAELVTLVNREHAASGGDNHITIDLNIMDDEGNVVDGTTSEMTREQISDVVDHAAQLILIRRSAKRSSGDTDDVMCELEEALVVAGVIDQIEAFTARL